MFIITKMSLPRRTFLRGVGATLALPLLDAMVPALSERTRTAAKPTPRLGFIYVPNGAVMDKWPPAGNGKTFEFSQGLSPLAPFRDRVLVLSGLAQMEARSYDDGAVTIRVERRVAERHPRETNRKGPRSSSA